MSSKDNPEMCTSPALSATKEDNASPEPHTLGALQLEMSPVCSQELSINSHRSSPTNPDSFEPPSIDHWRLLTKIVCDNLTSNLGLSATDQLRRSIPDGRYWRIEAEHYADQWKKQQVELSPGAEPREGTLNMGDLRYLIKDKRYWEIEALFYSNYETKLFMSKGFRRMSPSPPSRVGNRTEAPQELGAQWGSRSSTSIVDNTRDERAPISIKSSSHPQGEEGATLPSEPSALRPSEDGEKELTNVENKQRRKHTAESLDMQSHGKR
ncbi:hypothetical protein MMC31_001773 [Peltigera leucophlebia]|nr:hypothetical protein [Peltigera leucophlebia]